MTDPPKQRLKRISQPLPDAHVGIRFTKAGVFSLLILIALLLLLFSGQLLVNLFQVNGSPAKAVTANTHQNPVLKNRNSTTLTPSPTQDLDAVSPIFTPGNASPAPLQLPAGYAVIYEQTNGLYIVSSSDNISHKIAASGYVYSEAVPPILTPSGQLLYSGNGIWLIDPFGGTPTQIADLPPGQVITSMALSNDGNFLFCQRSRVAG